MSVFFFYFFSFSFSFSFPFPLSCPMFLFSDVDWQGLQAGGKDGTVMGLRLHLLPSDCEDSLRHFFLFFLSFFSFLFFESLSPPFFFFLLFQEKHSGCDTSVLRLQSLLQCCRLLSLRFDSAWFFSFPFLVPAGLELLSLSSSSLVLRLL